MRVTAVHPYAARHRNRAGKVKHAPTLLRQLAVIESQGDRFCRTERGEVHQREEQRHAVVDLRHGPQKTASLRRVDDGPPVHSVSHFWGLPLDPVERVAVEKAALDGVFERLVENHALTVRGGSGGRRAVEFGRESVESKPDHGRVREAADRNRMLLQPSDGDGVLIGDLAAFASRLVEGPFFERAPTRTELRRVPSFHENGRHRGERFSGGLAATRCPALPLHVAEHHCDLVPGDVVQLSPHRHGQAALDVEGLAIAHSDVKRRAETLGERLGRERLGVRLRSDDPPEVVRGPGLPLAGAGVPDADVEGDRHAVLLRLWTTRKGRPPVGGRPSGRGGLRG